jgi:potassium-dependent mechanosensitive channel
LLFKYGLNTVKNKILLLSIVILFVLMGGTIFKYAFQNTQAIHIAFVAGLSDSSVSDKTSFVEGAQLYIDKLNQQGGINGREVVLDRYDDQNDPELAKELAEKIVKENKAIAVIGHFFSDCSISAGKIYQENSIPAVTPFSTNVKVTQDNEWYFRTIFDDNLQGRFLANYVKDVFVQNTASIIYSDDAYGTHLNQVFSQTAKDLGIEIKYQWKFDKDDAQLDDNLEKIVTDLKNKSDETGVIFLATHAKGGIKLLKLFKDRDITTPLVASDAFSSDTFLQSFQQYPKEQKTPGYYTDGLYVATPLIFDSANEKALSVKTRYQMRYPKEPIDWHTVFAYDAAMMLVDAMKNAEISGTQDTLQEDRQKLKDYLADKLMSIQPNAIEGVAGFNYFDEQGNAQKPILMGVYKKGSLISAPIQFQDIPNLDEISVLKTFPKNNRLLRIGDKLMFKTNVVYTGIKINQVSDVDLDSLTYMMDFYLWFRFMDGIEPQNIEFLNAVNPIQLDKLKEDSNKNLNYCLYKKNSDNNLNKKNSDNNLNYCLYHIKGQFKINFWPQYRAFGQHLFGVSFRHRKLPRGNLIYVRDAVGMALFKEASLTKKLQQSQIFEPKFNGNITRSWLFQDTTIKDSLGHPKLIGAEKTTIKYSRFNMVFRAKKDQLTLFSLLSLLSKESAKESATIIWPLSLVMILLLLIITQSHLCQRFFPLIYAFQMIFVFLLLLSTEILLICWFMVPYHFPNSYLEATIIAFDMGWWIIGAIFVHIGSVYFLWKPLENKADRPIPELVYRLWVFTIYLLAFFGIIGFVFERPITSFLATSGVMAMIIGLAVQMNLSNIFSGLAINLERPFQIGDFVKIGSYDEGVVEEINWRATRIRTRSGFTLNIQNSTVVAENISNFSSTDNLWLWPIIYIDPRYPPEVVKKILDEALLSVEGLVKNQTPVSMFVGVNEWAASYWMCVCLDDYGKKYGVLESVWDKAWAALDRAGIQPAIRRQEIYTFDDEKERKWEPPTFPGAVPVGPSMQKDSEMKASQKEFLL